MQVDVTDKALMAKLIQEQDNKTPFDLVLANAGISPLEVSSLSFQDASRAIFETNIDGVLNTVLPLIGPMKIRNKGQIVLMSSLASYFPLNGAYSGSKAAVRLYGENLRILLKRFNIGVTILCPGFVRTPMTAKSKSKLPGIIDLEPAMKIMFKAIRENQAVVVFPKLYFYLCFMIAALPAELRIYIANLFASGYKEKSE